jgi:hypothetical protein
MGVTNNKAHRYTVELLEEIYTNPDFPQGSPQLETSLQNCGKSRADLWAFAGIVAIGAPMDLDEWQWKEQLNLPILLALTLQTRR